MLNRISLAILAWVGLGSTSEPLPPQQPVVAMPVLIDPADPAHVRIGALTYLGGWKLESRDPGFGGYSALAVREDRFMALSDDGNYLLFRMAAPGQIDQVAFGNLPDHPGRRGRKSDADSESMVLGPDGRIWVGFEVYNAIYRFAPGLTGIEARAFPPLMREWPRTTGPEAMARLADGRFVVLSENKLQVDGSNMGLLFAGDPTDPKAEPVRFGYKPPAGYFATDAQPLPDGRILVLNRHFALMDGLWAVLTILDPRDMTEGAILTGKPVAELRPPLTVDNMEGLAVTRERGRTIVWMISDDNQSPVQRTLLLKFGWNL